MLAVPPIRPDVCLLHAQQADEAGNVQYLGPPFFDAMLAQASRKVIVSVDRIVSTATVRASNHLTKLPSALVDMVVHAPFGAHPTASPSLYRNDEDHLREYVRASRTSEEFMAYLEAYVRAERPEAYLDVLGGGRLAALGMDGGGEAVKAG
jgi:glutaconate CoA-transferase subunit A